MWYIDSQKPKTKRNGPQHPTNLGIKGKLHKISCFPPWRRPNLLLACSQSLFVCYLWPLGSSAGSKSYRNLETQPSVCLREKERLRMSTTVFRIITPFLVPDTLLFHRFHSVSIYTPSITIFDYYHFSHWIYRYIYMYLFFYMVYCSISPHFVWSSTLYGFQPFWTGK